MDANKILRLLSCGWRLVRCDTPEERNTYRVIFPGNGAVRRVPVKAVGALAKYVEWRAASDSLPTQYGLFYIHREGFRRGVR